MNTEFFDKVIAKAAEFSVAYGTQLVGAAIILAIGLGVGWWLARVLADWLAKRELEPPLRSLIVRVAKLLMFGLTMTLVLDKLGVPIAPLIAGVGVAGVGIGLAMQGVLGNLIAGLTIIFTKPFRVGEYVELVGVHGQITAIELFSTVLLHEDRSRVVIPNRKIVGEIVHNYGQTRQLNLSVGVDYSTNLADAVAAVRAVLAASPRVLKSPEAVVGVSSLADSSISIAIKPWVKLEDFVPAGAELNQAIVEQFRARGIDIPFPQCDVRLLNAADPPRHVA